MAGLGGERSSSPETIEEITLQHKGKGKIQRAVKTSQRAPEFIPVQTASKEASKPATSPKAQPKTSDVKQEWRGTSVVNARWFESIAKPVPLRELAWDLKKQHGQSRVVRDDHVASLVKSLLLRPPRHPLQVTTWWNAADRRHYIMAGQHVARAVAKIAESRQAEGLPLADWHKFVCADVLKFETPLEDRQLVVGADNASTRVLRVTKVSECLAALREDPKSREGVSTAICRHVENCGMNYDQDNPVWSVVHTLCGSM